MKYAVVLGLLMLPGYLISVDDEQNEKKINYKEIVPELRRALDEDESFIRSYDHQDLDLSNYFQGSARVLIDDKVTKSALYLLAGALQRNLLVRRDIIDKDDETTIIDIDDKNEYGLNKQELHYIRDLFKGCTIMPHDFLKKSKANEHDSDSDSNENNNRND